MKKMAIDVDGVLLNFMKSFDKAAEIVLKRPIEVQKDEIGQDFYHLSKRVNTTEEQVEAILQYMLDSRMYAEFEAIQGVKKALKKIEKLGYEITIVTALPESAKDMRLENLKNVLDFVPSKSYFVGMGKSKKEALLELNPDIFLDDRIEYLVGSPHIYHLAWIDQKESQKDKESQVDVHVHSLEEWVKVHLPRIDKELNNHYFNGKSLQIPLKLESHNRKYYKP